MRAIAMIPARLGSQRLAKKNLIELRGKPLIAHAVAKCVRAGVFDEVWVNSESDVFAPIAESEGARFHQRPEALGSNTATSEQFVQEFLEKHDCDLLVQVHSIAPLLTMEEVRDFTEQAKRSGADVTLSVVEENLEHLCRGEPVNFTYAEKTNSQDLPPVHRISWAITSWRRATYLDAIARGACATYAGERATFVVGKMAGHVIKTQQDFDIVAALWEVVHGKG
ncbi:MAG TPA: NTP transferase domain-containing protein [Methylosinus sp.]|jgi:CMP-N-acetylneuraminic acid synthetase